MSDGAGILGAVPGAGAEYRVLPQAGGVLAGAAGGAVRHQPDAYEPDRNSGVRRIARRRVPDIGRARRGDGETV